MPDDRDNKMSDQLSIKSIEAMLLALRRSVRREECFTCDCLQGFLTQLEIDAEPAAAELVEPLKAPATQMHCCLGCDPCPPGEVYADYLRNCACRRNEEECG